MKILYVAKHGSGDNDDEGAIGWALERLRHEVIRLQEPKRNAGLRSFNDKGEPVLLSDYSADLMLFHKWDNPGALEKIRMPKVFWYFDMVDSTDPTLTPRCEHRKQWMSKIVPQCLAGFCTDGDWVDSYNLGFVNKPLVHLMQGADERVAGFGTTTEQYPPILFMGMVNHGQKRAEHIAELEKRYGDKFWVLGNGGALKRKHGRDLANILSGVRIIIAPDGPNTDRYWSNRVYLTTSLGGFLLHPYCEGLARQYEPGVELIFYHTRSQLNFMIDQYLEMPKVRLRFRTSGFTKTMGSHTYRHRCEELVKEVERRL